MASLRYTLAAWLLLFWVEVIGWIGLISPEAVTAGLIIYARGVLRGAGLEEK